MEISDIIFNICNFLDIINLLNCSKINKKFYRICNDNRLYNFYFDGIFINDYKKLFELSSNKSACIKYFKIKKLIFKLRLTILPFDLYQKDLLDLSYFKLRTIPKQIGELTNLRILLLDHNKIKKLPISIKKLKKLRELWLNNNDIDLIIPKCILEMPNLKINRY